MVKADISWSWVRTPAPTYWMDESDVAAITLKEKITKCTEIKVAKWGTPKKIFLKIEHLNRLVLL